MKRFKRLSIFVSIFFYFFVLSVAPALAQFTEPLREGNDDMACVVNGVVTIRGIECVLANILSIAVSGIGFAGFVMLLIGSYQYLLSGGNAKGVEGGKNTMTFAIAGLVVSLTSWMILNFIATFTGVETIKRFTTFFSG